jgi:hypothetical protein
VAVPVFAAACCGTKFAYRWRVSSLPPRPSATSWRKFANRANRSDFTSTAFQPCAAILPQLLLRHPLPQQLRLFAARNLSFFAFSAQLSSPHCSTTRSNHRKQPELLHYFVFYSELITHNCFNFALTLRYNAPEKKGHRRWLM